MNRDWRSTGGHVDFLVGNWYRMDQVMLSLKDLGSGALLPAIFVSLC